MDRKGAFVVAAVLMLLIVAIVLAASPQHNTPPTLTSPAYNYTNITCVADTYDPDMGDNVTNIFGWEKNGVPWITINYPFDSDDSCGANCTKDYSGNGKHGQLGGSADGDAAEPTWASSGQIGGAYTFDGNDDYITLDSGIGFDTWTVNVWVYAHTIPTGGADIYSQAHTAIVDDWVRLMVRTFNPGDGNNIPRATVYLRDGVNRDWYGNTSLSTNTWYMLTFVRNGNSDERIYVNGKQESLYYRFSNNVNPTLNTENIGRIDRGGAGASNYFNGTLDNFMMWDTNLSDAQIKQLYEDTKNGYSDNRTIVSQETFIGELWQCFVTPNDGSSDGPTNASNNVTIQAPSPNSPPQHNTPPTLTSPAYNDTNLTCVANTSDLDIGDTVTNIFNWLVNETSLMTLNLPFETNNSTFTRDYSGHGNNGSISGGATWTNSSKVGGGYDFDGTNGYIDVGSDSSLKLSELTVSAWVNFDTHPTAGNIYGVISRWDTGANQRSYTIYANNQYIFGAMSSDGTWGVGKRCERRYNLPNTGEWHHFTAVFGGPGNCQFYMDGVDGAVANLNETGTVHPGTASFLVGAHLNSGVAYRFFDGRIDEVQVFNRSLSPEQIMQLYNDTKNGFSDNRTFVSQETQIGEQWQCSVTPNDGHPNTDGPTNGSNIVPIQAAGANVTPILGISFDIGARSLDWEGVPGQQFTGDLKFINIGNVTADVEIILVSAGGEGFFGYTSLDNVTQPEFWFKYEPVMLSGNATLAGPTYFDQADTTPVASNMTAGSNIQLNLTLQTARDSPTRSELARIVIEATPT